MLAILAVGSILLAACGHSDPAPTAGDATTTTAKAEAATGDFGTMKGVCGPGDPKSSGKAVRGVSDSTIQIGVLNDATSTLSPGLGAGYLDVAKAFTDWCNEAGGINGRKIEFVGRDAQISQAAARIIDACQSDFMLVGGATPFDANTVQPREKCGLGAIPAYAASPEAIDSKLQALPTRVANKQANLGMMRLLEPQFADAFQKIGMMAVDTPSLLKPSESTKAAMLNAGYKITSYQKLPLTTDNWRTVVQPLVGTAEAVAPAPSDPTALFQAINDVGYKPTLLFNAMGNAYNQQLITSMKAAPIDAPFYLGTTIYPLELEDQNPATKLAHDLTDTVGSKLPWDAGAIPPWASWLLFAQSATACGNDLTVQCVIDKATAQKDYTAAGLLSPVDLSDPDAIPPCIAVLSATAKGFAYDEKITQPTDGDGGVFNCDPENVVDAD